MKLLMTHEFIWLVSSLLGMGLLSFIILSSIIKTDKQNEKYNQRVKYVVGSYSLRSEETNQFKLAKLTVRREVIKEIASSLFSIDLNQSDTYPLKWWLVPPMALVVSGLIIVMASHPLGHRLMLFTVGWPVSAFFIIKYVFTWLNNIRNSKLLAQFPDALSSIVRCVSVGIPMSEALRTVASDVLEPTRSEFLILADKVSIGVPLDVALRDLSVRVKLTEYQFFATAVTLQSRSGGGITQTLETLAEVIRKRVGLKARGYALTAEARTSALILALLPFIAGGGIFLLQRPYAEMLFYTSSGQSCLFAALLLLGMGMGTIQYMIYNVLK